MSFKYLITEDGERVSIGRVTFIIILATMLFFWITGKTVVDTLFYTWVLLLVYNLSKKGIRSLDKFLEVLLVAFSKKAGVADFIKDAQASVKEAESMSK